MGRMVIMDDVQLAKDLLLGKKSVQLRRIATSLAVKLFMKTTGKGRKDQKYLMNLGKYLSSNLSARDKTFRLHTLDAPGKNHDFLVLEIICTAECDANSIVNRFEEYEEVAL